MSEKKMGYTTVTYTLRLYDRHHNWLVVTKQLYNQLVWHYCKILEEKEDLLKQTNFLLLRKLEEITVGTKEMRARQEEPIRKLYGFPKVPLYFRRAAINTAIRISRMKREQKGLLGTDRENHSPVFYKGMYRDFQDNSVELKVYNGEKWVWVRFPFTGREIPKDGKMLSPTLKLEKKDAYLHVPVELSVSDIRTVKERMETEQFICAVAFSNSDRLAVCVKMQIDGSVWKSYFVHGGKKREAQRNAILVKLKKSESSRSGKKSNKNEKSNRNEESNKNGKINNKNIQIKENKRFYQKLKRINRYYAEQGSSEILKFCMENKIKIIVVPNYEGISNFYWQGRAMIRYLKRKAFRQGIVVTTVRPYYISSYCSECGGKIQKYRESCQIDKKDDPFKKRYATKTLFYCVNGHRGNIALNTAKNIGRQFLQKFEEEK